MFKLTMQYRLQKIRDAILIWIAWRLPRSLAGWAFVRVATAATVGKWSDTELPALTACEALRRWHQRS